MNPWRVLGIARTDDMRAIQRAYAARLRLHRPDEDPEGYQQVRAAYDAVVNSIRFDDAAHGAEAEPAPDSTIAELAGEPIERRPFDAAIQYAECVAQMLNEKVPLEHSQEWRSLFDDEVLFDLHVRSWLSMKIFGLFVELCRRRSAGDLGIDLFRLMRAFSKAFAWQDDELVLARNFSAEDIDLVMGFAVGQHAVSTEPITSGHRRWPGWRGIVLWISIVAVVKLVAGVYQDVQRETKPKSIADARMELANGNFRQAARMFEAIHRNEPGNREATLSLARSLGRLGEYDRAYDVLGEHIAAHPNDPGPFYVRAQLAVQHGEFADAKRDFDQALDRAANNPFVANELAWLLATCPDDEVRDGVRATELARMAAKASTPPLATHIDTLAAALAESNHYDEAVLEQRRAIELLKKDEAGVRDGMQARLELYLVGKPYRMAM